MNENICNEIPIIYITGFGPFGKHSENASQKVVEKLALLNIDSDLKVKLETDILDVAYKPVLEKIPNKWKTSKPKLVIHIGVSELAENIVLEKQSFNNDYCQPDINSCCVQSKQCLIGFPETLQTQLDLEGAIKDLENNEKFHLKCSVSTNPGRFLCGFVYYLSLSVSQKRSLFIHVPVLSIVHEDQDVAAYTLASTVGYLNKNIIQSS
ncbi:Pyroglutamyl-peptidase 1 [Armadillidium nasatum]|uniref:Pyroglutamyl-peptidase 1 n=1 Tax=Armadillidium nasatum TaxID=96803 RepID=A0A5N5T5L5_9CRUS|nr:Pyroglutamyl-peptidase 1 [Armadillidium nasatum]